MTNIHIGGSGKPCVDASTGNIKLHSGCCATCSWCDGTTNNAPKSYKVEFKNILDGTCGDCEEFRRSYLVPNTSSCTWSMSTTDTDYCSLGTGRDVQLIMSAAVSPYTPQVQITYTIGGSLNAVWRNNYGVAADGTKPDCTAFNAESIAWYTGTLFPHCVANGTPESTCELTAL